MAPQAQGAARPPRPYDVLLLADDRHPSESCRAHIAALAGGSRHHVYVANPGIDLRGKTWLERLDLDRFDAVVLHFTLYGLVDHWLSPRLREKVAAFRGAKLQFLQDEYRLVDAIQARLLELGVHTLFTLVRPDLVERAYPRLPRVRKVSTLPGLVPEELAARAVPPVAARRRHLGYRSRRPPLQLGLLAQDKGRIADGVLARAAAHGLEVDVSVREEDRIYGPAWFEFITSSKAVLGTEGGSSIWDPDGAVERGVEAYLARRPGASYEEVAREVLAPNEGNLDYATSSPRLFEAAALRTPMVLFPGRYDGVVEPDRHYIPLAKDFSNFAEVAAKLKDDALLQALADRTYADLVASGRYGAPALGARFDEVLEETVRDAGAPLAPRRASPDATRDHLARTTAAMRRVATLPLGEIALPAAHEASVLLDPDAGPLPARLARGACTVPWHVATLPARLLEIVTRGRRRRLWAALRRPR